jgi:hypothetical protein
MATNPYAPNGLSVARSRAGGAATYQNNNGLIKVGYTSSIGRGDLINKGTGAYSGYGVISLLADIGSWGVFGGVYPYYDSILQATSHGLIGSYQAGASPTADIPFWLIDDPFVTFTAQVLGGPWLPSWSGQNINFLAGTNGAPNSVGQSTLALDGGSVATTSSLPFQIIGTFGTSGGPQDPANVNPWLEVRLNTAAILNPVGR